MDITLYRYQLPLTHPLTFHNQTIQQREGLLLHWGSSWSEIAPLPGFSRETLAEAEQETIEFLTAFKQGKTIPVICPSVQFGLDCARRSWPVLKHTPLPPYLLLQGTPEDIIWSWKEWLYDYPSRVKLKVARYPMRDELAMIREIIRLAPKTKLILDANQQWTREEAWTFMSHLDASRIEYIEDPCATYADIRAVASHTGIAVALDEILSAETNWDFFPQLKGLVLKPTLIGSLEKCQELVKKAKANGVKVVISSSHESQLGNRLLALLATEWSPEQAPGLDTLRYFSGSVLDDKQQVDTKQLQLVWQS
nr:o-succinylbenzoate synthase [uncultured Tolumonas sp.]